MSDILSTLLPAREPRTLYHYTTQSGLIGIIQKNEIWATHTQYLNDQREYIHALELVRRVLGDKRSQVTVKEDRAVLDEMIAAIGTDIQSINVCVCSFSEDGDSLSQWRAYGESTAGFAIGFSGEFLSTKAKEESAFLVPCVYEPDEQRIIVERFVDIVLEEILMHRGDAQLDDDFFWHRGGNLIPYLHRLAPVIKDSSFRDEKEWRIITRPLMCSLERFNFRQGKSTIVPYYRFPLSKAVDESEPSSICEVVIGPTPNLSLSAMSVNSLLVSHKLVGHFVRGGSVSVKESKIPYRAW